jgi:hypothetical protein
VLEAEQSSATVSVESGRIAIVPVRKRPSRVLSEYSLCLPAAQGRYAVLVEPEVRPRRGVVTRLSIRREQDGAVSESKPGRFALSVLAPFLYVGDPGFLYGKEEVEEEKRAIYASTEPRSAGSYRTRGGDVAVCVRIGGKLASLRGQTRLDAADALDELVLDRLPDPEA